MATYIKVSKVGDLTENSSKLIESSGSSIALIRSKDKYYAVANECTHVGGPMCEGPIVGDQVICPWHGAVFSYTTGQAIAGPSRGDLKVYTVRVVGDDIEIKI